MYIRVWCQRCGGTFEIYDRDDIQSHKARTCPHCQERATGETWAKVVMAYDAYKTASKALFMDATSKTRFTVDFMDDSIFANCRTMPPMMD